jgi:Novel toxin 16
LGRHASPGIVQKCLPWDSCKQLLSKIEAFSQCIMARQALMNACYGGGDQIHKQVVEELVNGLCKCIDLLVENGCATTEELDSCATELIRRCL